MAMDIYRFPMSYGVVTDGGKRFLGLVNSDGESAFVLYDLEENDTSVVAFATEAGYILEFSFAPVSDEGFAATVLLMVASIQAI